MATTTIKPIPTFKQLWKRIETSPPPVVEESIWLRILVQTLVILGIIATDIASGQYMSVWAIPLSIVGAIWSWRRRRHRNIMLKFLLALGMILVLFFFFGNLLASLNDTRLVLAQLLIQLQVLHSFDLPRRKDLGYSMVIGLILLGVAGTVSQTLSFAPLLIIFLVVALPTLSLDYQSRLGITPVKQLNKAKSEIFAGLKISNLAYLTLTIVFLGLVIFALMPRFSGYQFRSYPMSSPVDLSEERFEDNAGVINPGLGGMVGENGGRGIGGNGTPESGPGEVDAESYYGFNHKINQNLRGTMTPKLLMRIRSQAPGFWRMLAFDYYNGQGWEISREGRTINISRPRWSYRFSLPLSGNLENAKTIVQTYNMAADLPNIIPVLPQAQYLFFPTRQIAIDTEGSLRSPYYLLKKLSYTVVSKVPYRDRTLLREASSEYYPPQISNYYLQVPENIKAKVKSAALDLMAKSPQPLTSPYEQALFLAQSLKQQYTIQPDLPFFGEDEDLVEAFLFHYQGGYPDHFASVLTVMLRSLGIPARLAVGFAPGKFNPFTGYYLVYNTDAHALSEVYFPGQGWFAFDPIPGHELIPPSFQEEDNFSMLRAIWRWVAGWLPSPVSEFLNNLFETVFTWISEVIVKFWRLVSSSIIGFLTGMLSVAIVSFLIWLIFGQAKNWRQRRYLAKLAPMDRLYRQMLNWLQEQGYPKHPAQTPLEYAQIAQEHHQPPKAKIIEEISQAYVKWRYGQQTPNVSYLYQQFKLLKTRQKQK